MSSENQKVSPLESLEQPSLDGNIRDSFNFVENIFLGAIGHAMTTHGQAAKEPKYVIGKSTIEDMDHKVGYQELAGLDIDIDAAMPDEDSSDILMNIAKVPEESSYTRQFKIHMRYLGSTVTKTYILRQQSSGEQEMIIESVAVIRGKPVIVRYPIDSHNAALVAHCLKNFHEIHD